MKLHAARLWAALAFGIASALVAHFGWSPSVRMSGAVPLLSLGAGLAHAVAGGSYGYRIFDRRRTPTAARACGVGALTSIMGQAIFIPPFAFWGFSSGAGHTGVLSFIAFMAMTGLFAFLAAGWALLLTSTAVGWALFKLFPNDLPR